MNKKNQGKIDKDIVLDEVDNTAKVADIERRKQRQQLLICLFLSPSASVLKCAHVILSVALPLRIHSFENSQLIICPL